MAFNFKSDSQRADFTRDNPALVRRFHLGGKKSGPPSNLPPKAAIKRRLAKKRFSPKKP